MIKMTGLYKKVLLAFLPALAVMAVQAQQAGVTASLDTNAMLIGDHVGMTLKFNGPAGATVRWPVLPDTILGSITVIGRGKIDTTFSPDRKQVTYSQQLNITCYDSGFYTIPSIPFRYRIPPDTTTLGAGSQMLLLAVHTVKVDTTQAIKPIIGPMRVPLTFREMLPWILAGLLVAALVFAGIWYYRKRKRSEPVFVLRPKVVVPAHEQALSDLEKLRLKKLWQAGRTKEYHSELTEILRRYIEERFQVPALEQTSAEITSGLAAQKACPAKDIDNLNRLLVNADLVKFAKAQPLAAENEQSLADGIEFVRSTTPVSNA